MRLIAVKNTIYMPAPRAGSSLSCRRGVLEFLGQSPSDEDVEDMIREVDLDGDGLIGCTLDSVC